jgi:hypothetical protein
MLNVPPEVLREVEESLDAEAETWKQSALKEFVDKTDDVPFSLHLPAAGPNPGVDDTPETKPETCTCPNYPQEKVRNGSGHFSECPCHKDWLLAGGLTGEPSYQPNTLIPVPDIRQQDSWSCGACAAMAVGRYFGVGPEDLKDWKKALGTSKEASTDPRKIAEYLTSLGLEVEQRQDMTLDDLRDAWKAGKAVITPIQEYMEPDKPTSMKYGHFVTVVGLGLGLVIVADPSIENALVGDDADQAKGIMPISEADWIKDWHDTLDGIKYERFGIIVGKKALDTPPPETR